MTFRLDHVCRAALLTFLAGSAMAFDGQSAPSDSAVADERDALVQRTVDPPPAVPRIFRAKGDALRAAIAACWNMSLASDAAVRIWVIMNRDGTVESAEVADIGDDAGPDHQAAAQSALRAVLNPNCQPWPLPAREWPAWQIIELRFDPGNFF